jgi:hypothetical protein
MYGTHLALEDVDETDLARGGILLIAGLIVIKLDQETALQAAEQVLVGRAGSRFARGVGMARSVSVVLADLGVFGGCGCCAVPIHRVL